MNRRIQRLERELALEHTAPALDATPIKRRVNAALNADPSERKAYNMQKLKFAAVLAAAIVALTGTALAVTSNIDVLQIFFKGDTSSAQEYVQTPNANVSDGSFQVTLESCVTDGQDIFAVLTVQALTEDPRREGPLLHPRFTINPLFEGRLPYHRGEQL